MNIEGIRVPLWHKKWDRVTLLKKYNSVGDRVFGRGFKLKMYSDDERYFKSLYNCVHYGIDIDVIRSDSWHYFTGVDISTKKRRGNAIFTSALNGMDRYVVDIRRGNWTGRDRVNEIYDVYQVYRPHVILVENNAIQEEIVDGLRESGYLVGVSMPIVGYRTGSQKHSEDIGLPSLEVELSQGVWHICISERHDSSCQCAWCIFLSEARNYPFCSSADTVMAWWFSREAMRLYWEGVAIDKGTDKEDQDVNENYLPSDLKDMLEVTDDFEVI